MSEMERKPGLAVRSVAGVARVRRSAGSDGPRDAPVGLLVSCASRNLRAGTLIGYAVARERRRLARLFRRCVTVTRRCPRVSTARVRICIDVAALG